MLTKKPKYIRSMVARNMTPMGLFKTIHSDVLHLAGYHMATKTRGCDTIRQQRRKLWNNYKNYIIIHCVIGSGQTNTRTVILIS